MLGSPQVLRVVLMATDTGTMRLMPRMLADLMPMQRQTPPSWGPISRRMSQQPMEEVGGGDPTVTLFTELNILAHLNATSKEILIGHV